MPWQSSTINPATTSPAADITKLTNDLQVLRSVLGGGSDGDVPLAPVLNASTGTVTIASGNVGIGTATPGVRLDMRGQTVRLLGGGPTSFAFFDLGTDEARARWGVAGAADDFMTGSAQNDGLLFTLGANALIFGTNQLERMRIDGGGYLLVNQTARGTSIAGVRMEMNGRYASSTPGVAGYSFGANGTAFVINDYSSGSSEIERFRLGSAGEAFFPGVGTTASAANAFLNSGSSPANQLLRSTSSLRYKRDIEDIATDRVDAAMQGLRPIWYRSKAEADNKAWSWYGLIAEEVAAVEPRLVHWGYTEDAYESVEVPYQDTIERDTGMVGADSKPIIVRDVVTKHRTERRLKAGAEMVPDGVQYERLAVLLLAEVQALRARVAALEAA